MRLPLKRSLLVGLVLSHMVWANPIPVGPPATVDGKPVVMPVVKKWGQYWYPASLVGHNMGVEFAFDHATKTLYVDGSRLDMDTVVVDGIVYIPIKPRLSNGGMEPGMAMLKARRHEYEAQEHNAPEKAGNTQIMFMHTEVEVPAHPWEEEHSGEPEAFGPVIDLDPTGETIPVPGTMRPQEAPKPLPNRVSRIPAVAPPEQMLPTSSTGSMPAMVRTQGGPQGGSVSAVSPLPQVGLSSSPSGLQPIPGGGAGSLALTPRQVKNQAFELSLLGGDVQTAAEDRTLALKVRRKNISPVTQANLGRFVLRCQDGSRLEPVESRSALPSSALSPGGSHDGELVFRLAPGSVPASLDLDGAMPLSLDLLSR